MEPRFKMYVLPSIRRFTKYRVATSSNSKAIVLTSYMLIPLCTVGPRLKCSPAACPKIYESLIRLRQRSSFLPTWIYRSPLNVWFGRIMCLHVKFLKYFLQMYPRFGLLLHHETTLYIALSALFSTASRRDSRKQYLCTDSHWYNARAHEKINCFISLFLHIYQRKYPHDTTLTIV